MAHLLRICKIIIYPMPGNFAGTDGKQVGIYGGSFPYKEGAVPSPPHVRSKVIASSTDGQGKLNVQITTTAQDK
jgi:hypothetical protein